MTGYGPGTRLLADLTGRAPDAVATDAGEALRAVADLGRELAALAAARASDDPAVAAAARRRTDEVAARLRAAAAEQPAGTLPAAERLRTAAEQALRRLLDTLDPPDAAGEPRAAP